MFPDAARETRELILRGLDHFAHGRLREAAQDWECAVRLQPQDRQAHRLLSFVRQRLRERDSHTPGARHDTLESPIPAYLATLTVREGKDDGKAVEATPDDEWAKVDTRRILADMDEINVDETRKTEADDTWRELPVTDGKLLSSARGLVTECKTSLYAGRCAHAALAAEVALQVGEQAHNSDVDQLLGAAHPLFERAFSVFVGDMKSIPIRAIPPEDLAAYGFDHRAAFLMSRMDGSLNVSDLLHVAGMSRFEALRLLAALRRARAIDMVPVLS